MHFHITVWKNNTQVGFLILVKSEHILFNGELLAITLQFIVCKVWEIFKYRYSSAFFDNKFISSKLYRSYIIAIIN